MAYFPGTFIDIQVVRFSFLSLYCWLDRLVTWAEKEHRISSTEIVSLPQKRGVYINVIILVFCRVIGGLRKKTGRCIDQKITGY